MSNNPIKAAAHRLDVTRERLLLTSVLMHDVEQQLPLGRRSKRTKRFLAINLALFVGQYEKSIQELAEQRSRLEELSSMIGGAK